VRTHLPSPLLAHSHPHRASTDTHASGSCGSACGLAGAHAAGGGVARADEESDEEQAVYDLAEASEEEDDEEESDEDDLHVDAKKGGLIGKSACPHPRP
jgi:hypothetical protein